MTEPKWELTLSVTDRNNIGLIQPRKNNTHSELMRVHVTNKNGEPYDLTTLKVFFVTHFTGKDSLNVPVQKEGTVINAKEGIFEFTLDEDCMQKVGRQQAYFEIYDYDKFLDATQNFTYEIISSSRNVKADFAPYIETWQEAEKMLDEGTAKVLNDKTEKLELQKANVVDVNEQLRKQKQETDNKLEKKTNNDTFVAITSDMQRQIESTQSGMIGEYDSEAQLKAEYPNGAKGYAVVWFTENDKKVAYSFTYKNKVWVKGQVWNGVGIANNSIDSPKIIENGINATRIDLKSNTELSKLFCELGTINSSTGINSPSDTAMRTTSFIAFKKGETVDLVDKNFSYCPFLFNENGIYISSKGIWETGSYTFQIDCNVKFTFKRNIESKKLDAYLNSISKIIKSDSKIFPLIENDTQIAESSQTGKIMKEKSIEIEKIDFENNSILRNQICVLGTLEQATGEHIPVANAMHTIKFIEVKKGDYIDLIDDKFQFCPYIFNLDGSYNSSQAQWLSNKYIFNSDCLVKIAVKFKETSTEIKNYLEDVSKILTMPKNNINILTNSTQIAEGIINESHFSFDINRLTISHLYLKIWANLGDSITARGWYQQLIKDKFGIISQNFGVNGSTIARNAGYAVKSFVERMHDLPEDLDYLTIWGGVNDFGFGKYGFIQGSVLGTFDSRDDTTFYGALHKLFEYVINKYKKRGTRIAFIITTPVSQDMGGNGGKNSKGHTLEDYCQAAREVCEYYSIPYLDLQKNSGINQLNVDIMTSTIDGLEADGLHPSMKWFEMKQYAIANFLMKL